MDDALGAARFFEIAQTLYRDGPWLMCKSQQWRPYICPFERLVRYVRQRSRVLDIGCGAGLLLGLAAGLDLQFEGVGFDASESAIGLARGMADRAKSIFPKARLSFELVREYEAWPKETFDVVFLIDVLHHVNAKSQHEFLRRALSRATRDGVFVYKDMCLHPWWKAQANRLHDLVIARQRIAYLPVERIEKWAEESGMKVLVREELSRLWYGHELRVFSRGDSEPRS